LGGTRLGFDGGIVKVNPAGLWFLENMRRPASSQGKPQRDDPVKTRVIIEATAPALEVRYTPDCRRRSDVPES
jgi:hypothetical protein